MNPFPGSLFADFDSAANAVATVLILVLLVWSIVWVNRDAGARGKNGCLVMTIVLLIGWPISLLVWIALRPGKRSKDQN